MAKLNAMNEEDFLKELESIIVSANPKDAARALKNRIKPQPKKKIVTAYLHSERDSMYELAKEIGLSDEVIEKSGFTRALYEVTVELEVDMATGEYKIISFNE
jgi:hypothetical protein